MKLKNVFLFVSFIFLLISCRNPTKDKMLDRQEAINREMKEIYDSMRLGIYPVFGKNYRERRHQHIEQLTNEFDSLTKEIKKL